MPGFGKTPGWGHIKNIYFETTSHTYDLSSWDEAGGGHSVNLFFEQSYYDCNNWTLIHFKQSDRSIKPQSGSCTIIDCGVTSQKLANILEIYMII